MDRDDLKFLGRGLIYALIFLACALLLGLAVRIFLWTAGFI